MFGADPHRQIDSFGRYGWEILGGIDLGKAGPGGLVAGFDGGEPGRLAGKAVSGMEVADEGTNDGGVVGVVGSWGCRVSGNDVWWTVVGMIFRAERETP